MSHTGDCLLLDNQEVTVDNEYKLSGIANTLTKTRSGITVTESAALGVIGKKVPLLLSHDWNSIPVGHATMTNVSEEGLTYEGVLYDDTPNVELIRSGIDSGVLSVSIGFQVLGVGEDDDSLITKMDLLELSITAVPSDSGATVIKQAFNGVSKDDYEKRTKYLGLDEEEEPKKPDTDDKKEPTDDKKEPKKEEPNTDGKEVVLEDVLDAVNALSNMLQEFRSGIEEAINKLNDKIDGKDSKKEEPEDKTDTKKDDTDSKKEEPKETPSSVTEKYLGCLETIKEKLNTEDSPLKNEMLTLINSNKKTLTKLGNNDTRKEEIMLDLKEDLVILSRDLDYFVKQDIMKALSVLDKKEDKDDDEEDILDL